MTPVSVPFIPSRVRAAQAAAAAGSTSISTVTSHTSTGQEAAVAVRLPPGIWCFSALSIEMGIKEYAAFGYELGTDHWKKRRNRSYWPDTLCDKFEQKPLLAPLQDNFKLTADRQQRAMLICSHKTLYDHNIDRSSYVSMLLKVCEKLGDGTVRHTHPSTTLQATSTPSSPGQPGHHQQRLTIRSSKGKWLRSAKMHLKADVPVEPYLALLHARYGIAPLSHSEVSGMRQCAENDTRPFWPLLQEPAFRTSPEDVLGGLQLSTHALLGAGFSCLPLSMQPTGCQGAWWAYSKSPLLVFLPGSTSESSRVAMGDSSLISTSTATATASQTAGQGSHDPLMSASTSTQSGVVSLQEALPGPAMQLSGLSVSDAAPVQSNILEAATAAPAGSTTCLMTPGQVYDELSCFQELFMHADNKVVTGCSVCMVPSFVPL